MTFGRSPSRGLGSGSLREPRGSVVAEGVHLYIDPRNDNGTDPRAELCALSEAYKKAFVTTTK